jgi:hypothetical protein
MSYLAHIWRITAVALALALAACGGGQQTVPEQSEAAATPPSSVAPAPDVEQPAMKNWMLIEFTRAVEETDLQWLEENGFRVDTVMSETMVRGWLEVPEGGEVIGQDPRIARIHAQMR